MKTIHNDNTPACLTIRQLMTRWQCSRKAILNAVHRGELPAFRIGNRPSSPYRVMVEDVERYEKTRRAA